MIILKDSAQDLDRNEDLCADLDICDDEGEINNTHGYCTGEIVPHREYPPGGCPVGYHSYDNDESGFCYANDLGCRPNGASCGEIEDVCQSYPGLKEQGFLEYLTMRIHRIVNVVFLTTALNHMLKRCMLLMVQEYNERVRALYN